MHVEHLEGEPEAVVFDLGGVIIHIDPQLTYQAFAGLSSQPVDQIRKQFEALQVFERFETGHLSDEAFLDLLRQAIGNASDRDILVQAWNALLLDIPARKLHVIRELAKKYRVFLLSNTNSIHFKEVEQILNRQHGIRQFSDIMEGVVLSYEVNLRKPDLKIYDHIARKYRLEPTRTLFIDDSLPNVEGARQLGFAGIHYEPRVGLYDLLGYEF